jgi:Protein of unknown function (DUF3891)
MIVRSYASSRLLITQPDHAALAGRIMANWRTRGLPDDLNRASICRAVGAHDVGWREVDLAPLVDPANGQILDFVTAPVEVRQSVWPRAVERLADDPFAAALVAEHAIQIYSRFHQDAAWIAFFQTMAALRDEQARRASVSIETLRAAYFFVRAGDLISLTFCTGWLDPQTIDGHEIKLIGPNDVGIRPDPFDGVTVPFEISARALPNRRFASADEAAQMFHEAPIITLHGTAKGLEAET